MRNPSQDICARSRIGLRLDFVGLANVYAVGAAVVREILGNWDRWRDGPPLLP